MDLPSPTRAADAPNRRRAPAGKAGVFGQMGRLPRHRFPHGDEVMIQAGREPLGGFPGLSSAK